MSLLVKYMCVGMKQHQRMTTQCIKWADWNYYALVSNHVVSGHHADLIAQTLHYSILIVLSCTSTIGPSDHIYDIWIYELGDTPRVAGEF
jgi:hypothetical protein